MCEVGTGFVFASFLKYNSFEFVFKRPQAAPKRDLFRDNQSLILNRITPEVSKRSLNIS